MKNNNDKRDIHNMKQDYNNIKVPSELKKRVEESMMEGKKDKNKKSMIQITKFSTIAAVASMLLIFVLANSSQSMAYAMEKLPIIGSITRVVTFRTYTDKTNNFEANIRVPKIEPQKDGESIKNATNEVNKSIEDYTNQLIEQYNNDLKASEGEGHYAVDTSYEVITDNDDMFTLRIDTVVAMGGSNSFSKFYHIDKRSGNVITLKDVFQDKADYISVISNNIKEQMQEQMKADEMITYFLNDKEIEEWNFKEIKADQNFYFNEKEELVIVFDKYEVAPGYMGMVEFTIPKDKIENIVNK